MLLTNHDLHDLYAVFLILRASPAEETNEIAVRVIQEIIDMPQTTNCIESNIIRNKLSAIPSLDREKWYFIDTQNVYTWGTAVVKDEQIYAILSACLAEMMTALQEKNPDRVSDLADALHNIPIILTEGKKGSLRAVKRQISYVYRSKWNKDFLKSLL